MGLILDSSVVIAAERRGQDVVQILEAIANKFGEVDVGMSVITVAELEHGAYRGKDQSGRSRRLKFVDELCRDIAVYPITLEIARRVGRIQAEQAANGIAIAFQDLAIGVTALELGFQVATLNVRDFQKIPSLSILSA